MAINLNKIVYKNWNERDLEIPATVEFVKSRPDIKTLLDVGSHYSSHYYAPLLRPLLPYYAGIDILPDPQTEKILDQYIVGNVLEKKLTPYDAVISISSLEHAGISTYKVANYKEEQQRVFKKIMELSQKYVFLTFPFGKEALHPGEFANITYEQIKKFYTIADDLWYPNTTNVSFYFSEFPQGKQSFKEVDIDFAMNIEYKPELGTRCVCFLTIGKL